MPRESAMMAAQLLELSDVSVMRGASPFGASQFSLRKGFLSYVIPEARDCWVGGAAVGGEHTGLHPVGGRLRLHAAGPILRAAEQEVNWDVRLTGLSNKGEKCLPDWLRCAPPSAL